MTSKDIDRLVRWSVDSNLKKFAEDSYGVTGSAYDEYEDYLRGKFRDMQTNFIRWIAGLDSRNRERLANNITKGE